MSYYNAAVATAKRRSGGTGRGSMGSPAADRDAGRGSHEIEKPMGQPEESTPTFVAAFLLLAIDAFLKGKEVEA